MRSRRPRTSDGGSACRASTPSPPSRRRRGASAFSVVNRDERDEAPCAIRIDGCGVKRVRRAVLSAEGVDRANTRGRSRGGARHVVEHELSARPREESFAPAFLHAARLRPVSPGRASRGGGKEIAVGEMLRIHAPGDVRFDTYESRRSGPPRCASRPCTPGISAGTELTHYRGTNPTAGKTWDADRRLFVPVPDPAYYPEGDGVRGGRGGERDRQRGAPRAEGDLVFGTCSTARVSSWRSRRRRRTGSRRPRADPGDLLADRSIALNGVLDAGIRLGDGSPCSASAPWA